MSVYLHDIPLPDAQARLKQALQDAGLWRVLGVETIPLDEYALGRVTAEPVWAKVSSPHYHASAMDGFAVRAIDTNGALPSKPISLQIGPQAEYVDTGDPLPVWANAVIPIENDIYYQRRPTIAVDAYVNFARRAPWQEAVCSSLTELFAPEIHRQRLASWPEHYPWIDQAGLHYFRSRVPLAKRDVDHGLAVTLDYFRTREQQQRALDILKFKLDVLWAMNDAMAQHYGVRS